jgi:hypothetical protein
MASLTASIMTKIDGLTAAGFPGSTVPKPYLDRAPQVQTGLQLRPPYLTVSVVGTGDDLTFESDSVEMSRVTITAFAISQGDADQMIAAVRFNNQTAANNAGLDNGTLPALTDGVLQSILATKPPTPGQAGLDKDGVNIYKSVMEWDVAVQRT